MSVDPFDASAGGLEDVKHARGLDVNADVALVTENRGENGIARAGRFHLAPVDPLPRNDRRERFRVARRCVLAGERGEFDAELLGVHDAEEAPTIPPAAISTAGQERDRGVDIRVRPSGGQNASGKFQVVTVWAGYLCRETSSNAISPLIVSASYSARSREN